VTFRDINRLGGRGILNRYGWSLNKALQAIYPHYIRKFERHSNHQRSNAHSKSQKLLYNYIKDIFPEQSVEYNYLHSSFQPKSNIQLDIFIPSLSLAFEYNGEYHYKSIPMFSSHLLVQKRDERKKLICGDDGITLIVIPYSWDRTLETTASIILATRPDLNFLIPNKN